MKIVDLCGTTILGGQFGRFYSIRPNPAAGLGVRACRSSRARGGSGRDDRHNDGRGRAGGIEGERKLGFDGRKPRFVALGPEPHFPIRPVPTSAEPTFEGLVKNWPVGRLAGAGTSPPRLRGRGVWRLAQVSHGAGASPSCWKGGSARGGAAACRAWAARKLRPLRRPLTPLSAAVDCSPAVAPARSPQPLGARRPRRGRGRRSGGRPACRPKRVPRRQRLQAGPSG